MSLQQNNLNKLPKHLQHVRLQKEEEEEQWISGEELCTEGSSDEDTATNDVRKKFKIKPSKELVQNEKSTASVSSVSSSKDSNEEAKDKNREYSPTEWRPKRDYFDAETEKWNAESKYLQVLNSIKSFKNHLNNTVQDTNQNVDNDKDMDNAIKNMDSNVIHLNDKLENLNQILQDCTEDRKKCQKEICKTLKSLNSEVELINTNKYLKIFCPKSPKKNSKKTFKQKIKSLKDKFCKNSSHKDKKMTNTLLKEEQRARLEFLLSDIEICESDKVEENNYNLHSNTMRFDNINGFKITDTEMENLLFIDDQIKALQETYDDADLKGKSGRIGSTNEESREWTVHLKMVHDKFRLIEDKIKRIRDQEEARKMKEIENCQE